MTEIRIGATDENGPAVVAWADNATAVLKGNPVEQFIIGPNTSWGDLSLRQMLEPNALEALIAKPWPELFHVDGDLLEHDMSLVPGLISLSTEYYEATYDAHLDVLTTWRAIIDGEEAQRIVLSHLNPIEIT